MKFISRSIARNNRESDQRPLERLPAETSSKAAQHQQAKNKILRKMAAFSHNRVQQFDGFSRGLRQQPPKHGFDEASGIVRSEPGSREHPNQSGPREHGPPPSQARHRMEYTEGKERANGITAAHTPYDVGESRSIIRCGSWELRA